MRYWIQRGVRYLVCTIVAFCVFCFYFQSTQDTLRFIMCQAPSTTATDDQTVPESPVKINPRLLVADLQTKLAQKRESNTDAKGWLYLTGINVDAPVMQTKDNDYYLRRDENKKSSYHGSYFSDFRTNLDPGEELSKNVVIYGHNIFDDGTFFSQLLHYEDWYHMVNNPYIYFSTPEGDYVYQIFAAYYTFIDFYYINPNPDEKEFAYVVDEAQKRSLFTTNLTVGPDDQIITLSTCAYKYKTSWGTADARQRFVVQAVRIDPNNPPPYVAARSNPNPKGPTD